MVKPRQYEIDETECHGSFVEPIKKERNCSECGKRLSVYNPNNMYRSHFETRRLNTITAI